MKDEYSRRVTGQVRPLEAEHGEHVPCKFTVS